MGCRSFRKSLVRLPDELTEVERLAIQAHIRECRACADEWQIFALPRRIGRVLPSLEVPPFFSSKMVSRVREESQGVSIWQIILLLSRHLVPALATITLAFISIFAYTQLRGPQVDLYQAYESVFMPADRPQQMVIADPGGITDESILRALAEDESPQHLSVPQTAPKRD